MKNILTKIIISIIIISILFSFPSVYAEDNTSGNNSLIYFDTNGRKNFSSVYCHVWVRGKDAFFDWQNRNEQCKKVSGTKYSYDLSKLANSAYVSGGIKNGEDYCIIFSNNIGDHTYDITFGNECIGDTVKMTGDQIENPIDNEKKAFEAVWEKNSFSYGPHLAVTSTGNIVGSKLCPNETGIKVIGDWLSSYYNSGRINITEVLKNCYSEFGINSIDEVYAIYSYIKSNNNSIDNDEALLNTLTNAFYATYGTLSLSSDLDVVYIGEKVKIKYYLTHATTKGTVKFSSLNPDVAAVNSKGVITARKAGETKIKVSYINNTEYFSITVIKPSITIRKKLTLPIPAKYTMKYTCSPVKSAKITWSSSNKKVAKVSSKGKISAISKGKAVITAKLTYKGKSYKSKCTLTVKKINTIEELIELLYE